MVKISNLKDKKYLESLIIIIIIIIILLIICYISINNKNNENFYNNNFIRLIPDEVYNVTPYFTGGGINGNDINSAMISQFLVRGPNNESILALSDGGYVKMVVINTIQNGLTLNQPLYFTDTTRTIMRYNPLNVSTYSKGIINNSYIIFYKNEFCKYETYMYGTSINNNQTPVKVTNYADGPNGEKIAIILDDGNVKMVVIESNSKLGSSPVGTAKYYPDTTINNYTPAKWNFASINNGGYLIYKSIIKLTTFQNILKPFNSPLNIRSIKINNTFATNFSNPINSPNSDKYLQISQVAVYAMVDGKETNVAPLGTAYASSIYDNKNIANYAKDGNLNPKPFSNTYCSSSGNNNEWWYLELNNNYNVHKIVYYNRSDSAKLRALGSQVELYSNVLPANRINTVLPLYTHTLNNSDVQPIEISPQEPAPPPPQFLPIPPQFLPLPPPRFLPPPPLQYQRLRDLLPFRPPPPIIRPPAQITTKPITTKPITTKPITTKPITTPFITVPLLNPVTTKTANSIYSIQLNDALTKSYDNINNTRETNLDNQERIFNLEKRIKKIKLDLIDITKPVQNSNIKPPKFY